MSLLEIQKKLDEEGPFTAISTHSGHVFDLHDRATWTYKRDTQLMDMVTSICNQTRYLGHINQLYSVAAHSIEVANWLESAGYDVVTQRLGLWHDITEAFLGDIPRPQKKHTFLQMPYVDWAAYPDAVIVPESKYVFVPVSVVEDELFMQLIMHFGLFDSSFFDRWKVVKDADYAVYQQERDARPNPGKFPGAITAETSEGGMMLATWLAIDKHLANQ